MDSKDLFPLPVERLSFTLNVESNRLYALDISDSDSKASGCFEFRKDSWFEFPSFSDFNRNTDASELEDTIRLNSKEAKEFILKSKSLES